MKQVAKIIIIDEHDRYLLLRRSAHPVFPNDPDLPGGIVEADEEILDGLVREIQEETTIIVSPDKVVPTHTGTEYASGYTYHLYVVRLMNHPTVTISWEHASFEWLSRKEFLEQIHRAADTYMHMVYDVTV